MSGVDRADGPLLEVQNLQVTYGSGRAARIAVSGISFTVRPGQTVGLVGESGSGKTTIGRAILGLVAPSGGRITIAGLDASDTRLRRRLVNERQAIFQDPFSSFNPALRVGASVLEATRSVGMPDAEASARMADLLVRVGLRASDADRYPASFSGGQRQRIAVARALIVSPSLVVCDEAVSALDVSIQAQILNLLRDLQDELGLAYLFIGHDLDVVRFMSDHLLVLQGGRLVEAGPAATVVSRPQHPYTQALLDAAGIEDRPHDRQGAPSA